MSVETTSLKWPILKSCFEGMGFTGVSTYIQSGNVIFFSREHDKAKLTGRIEKELSEGSLTAHG